MTVAPGSGPGGRWYVRPATGVSYPSVTTVLDMIAKPFLMPWAARLTAEWVADNLPTLANLGWDDRVKAVKGEWNRVRAEAADRGTAVHQYADDYLSLGLAAPPLTRSHASVLEAIDVLSPEVLFTETTVVNEQVGYMGTLDGLWRVQGETWLIDWKSGKRTWADYALQALAYERADAICVDDSGTEVPMPKVDRKVLIHCPLEGLWTMVEASTTEDDWAAVLAAHALFMWEHTRAKVVLGEPQTAVTMLGIVKVAETMLRGMNK